ncbi:hypothetical protein LOK49_Contig204G00004, partial [Camellia lanceoleosa]
MAEAFKAWFTKGFHLAHGEGRAAEQLWSHRRQKGKGFKSRCDGPQVMAIEHVYNSPTKVEPLNNYGVTNDKWRRPSRPGSQKASIWHMEKVEPLNNYGVTDDKWRRPSNPVRDGPQVMATEYVYNSPTKVEPLNNYGVTNDKWRRPSRPGSQKASIWHMEKVEPLNNYGVTDDKWRRPSNPVRDGPQVMATEYVYNSPTK